MNIDNPLNHANPPSRPEGVAISVRRLCKSFEGAPVLKDISFEIKPGELFVIMGPSGAGKTVLLNHLIGLLEPDSGEVLINGISPLSDTLQENIRMAMVFQNSGLLNSLSVEENVSLYLSEHRLKPANEIRQIVSEQLSHLNLNQADADKYPYELSGGMKKRVAIARPSSWNPKSSSMTNRRRSSIPSWRGRWLMKSAVHARSSPKPRYWSRTTGIWPSKSQTGSPFCSTALSGKSVRLQKLWPARPRLAKRMRLSKTF